MRKEIVCFKYLWGSKYFIGGDIFEEGLLLTLQDALDTSKKEKHEVLLEAINSSTKHPEDVLMGIFERELEMDFEFARELRMFDMIGSNCFSSETATGKALIDLMSDCAFILESRFWGSPDYLHLEFRVADRGMDIYLLMDMIKGNLRESNSPWL